MITTIGQRVRFIALRDSNLVEGSYIYGADSALFAFCFVLYDGGLRANNNPICLQTTGHPATHVV
jgi:hypothetical protein